MKKILQLVIVLCFSITATAQSTPNDDAELIKQLITDSFQDIFSDFKIESVEDHLTPEFLLLEHGEVWDVKKLTGYMERGKARGGVVKRINSFEFIKVEIKDGMAWTAYHNTAVFEQDGVILREMNWLESASAILTNDGWKLQMLHSTRIEEE